MKVLTAKVVVVSHIKHKTLAAREAIACQAAATVVLGAENCARNDTDRYAQMLTSCCIRLKPTQQKKRCIHIPQISLTTYTSSGLWSVLQDVQHIYPDCISYMQYRVSSLQTLD